MRDAYGVDRLRRLARARFMLAPWRFELEYARAWRELDFPLYGLDRPDVIERCMGAKGRGGKVPRPPVRWLPAGLWTDLIHLGVIERGARWTAEVDTWTGHHQFHRETMEHRLESAALTRGMNRAVAPDMVDSPRPVDVDGIATHFDGLAMGEIWTGAANLHEVSVSVITVGLEETAVSIHQIEDPTPYLLKSVRS